MTEKLKVYRQGAAELQIRTSWCKGCNLCVDACPKEILALDELEHAYLTDIDRCIFCGLCAERCPDFCISLERPETRPRVGLGAGAKETA